MENKKKTLLITGAGGFVGKNLVAQLRNEGWNDLLLFDVDTPKELLADYAARADFVFHLAGVNRPQNPDEFYEGNRGFTEHLLALLAAAGNKAPVLVTSSIQAELDNDYGKSKREAEELIFATSAPPARLRWCTACRACSANGAARPTTALWPRSATTSQTACPSTCGTRHTASLWYTSTTWWPASSPRWRGVPRGTAPFPATAI